MIHRFRNVSRVTSRPGGALLLAVSLAVATLAGIGCDRAGRPGTPTGGQNTPTVQIGPEIPDFSVWRPFFRTDFGDHVTSEVVGTGFAVVADDGDAPRLVTSLRLIGPLAGLDEPADSAAAWASVNEVWLTDAFGVTDTTLRAGEPIESATNESAAEESATPSGDAGASTFPVDLAASELIVISGGPSQRQLKPFRLGDHSVSKGDIVYMVTAVFGGAPASQKCHQATITSVGDDGYLEYTFENQRLSLHAASGAPLLDEGGRVVGVHLAGTTDGIGETVDFTGAETSKSDGPVTGRGMAAAALASLL